MRVLAEVTMQRDVKVSPAVKAEILRLLECVPRGLSADSLSKVAQIHRLDIEAGLVALGAGGAVASRIVVWRDDAASAQLVHQRRGDRRGARCGERYWQQPGQQLAAVSWREHAEAERLAQPVELLAPGLRPGGVGGETDRVPHGGCPSGERAAAAGGGGRAG